MRSILPVEFVLIYLVYVYFEDHSIKYFLALIFISSVFGSLGSVKEFKNRWQKREVYTWSESQLIESVKLNISSGKFICVYPSSEDRRWVELIPMFGERTMISPDFVSSSVYYIPRFPSQEEEFMDLYRDIIYPQRRIKYGTNFSLKNAYIQLFDYYSKLGAEYLIIPTMSTNIKQEQLYLILESDKNLKPIVISDFRLYKISDLLIAMNNWNEIKDNNNVKLPIIKK